MTENEVTVMLAEAIDQDKEYKSWHVSTKHLMTFANLVAAKEREACAKLCDSTFEQTCISGYTGAVHSGRRECAFAIRARGQA